MKLKKSTLNEAQGEGGQGGGAFISARLRNPAEEMAMAPSGKGDVLYGIFAIIATLLLLITAILLYVNWDVIKVA